LNFRFDGKRVRIVHEAPGKLLDLRLTSRGLELHLLFRYGGREFPANRREEMLILPSSDAGEILLARRALRYEEAVSAKVAAVISRATGFMEIPNKWYGEREQTPPAFIVHLVPAEFLALFGRSLIDAGIDLRLGETKKIIRKGGGRVFLRINTDIDWFGVEARYEEDGAVKDLSFDEESLASGVVKAGDEFRFLSREDIDLLVRLNREGGRGRESGARINKNDLALIDAVFDRIEEGDREEAAKLREAFRSLQNFSSIKDYPLPRGFHGLLRPYQKAGYNWLNFLRDHGLNGCLADDMGLGKTVQALALLQGLKAKAALGTSLIVVPVTTMANWMAEIRRFAPGLRAIMHIGAARDRRGEAFNGADIVLTSYHTLQRDAAAFTSFAFHYLILDEAQYIKNAATKTFRAVKSLTAERRLSLTGTPVAQALGTSASALALDAQGNGLLAWAGAPGGGNPVLNTTELFVAPVVGGQAGAPVQLTNDANGDYDPQLVKLADGRFLVTWERNRTANLADPGAPTAAFLQDLEIAYSVFDPALGTATAPQFLTDDSYVDHAPKLAVSPSGQVLLTWLANPANVIVGDSTNPDELTSATWSGGSFSTPQTAFTIAGPLSASLAYGGSEAAEVFGQMNDTGGMDVSVAHFDGTSWGPLLPLTADGLDNLAPQLVFTPDGNPFVVWNRQGQLVYVAGDWTNPWTAVGDATGTASASAQRLTLMPMARIFPSFFSFSTASAAAIRAMTAPQIGRASCRERV